MSSKLRRARPEQCVIHFDAWPQAKVSVLQELPVQVRFNPESLQISCEPLPAVLKARARLLDSCRQCRYDHPGELLLHSAL
ncbi:hypothetical protein H9L39_14619 [Fusarium oxysporum f. sp. albedinis]|nr:hypothetical protein H9L39_14619 [Fusarium oxysporum f. sp. albedinis]